VPGRHVVGVLMAKRYEVRLHRTVHEERTVTVRARDVRAARARALRISGGSVEACTERGESGGEWYETTGSRTTVGCVEYAATRRRWS
jgi:hypothetical protein